MVDTAPLRTHPAFRRLWMGTSTSTLSSQVVVVAVLFQVWEITASSAWVGVIGLATAIPTIVCGLIGGQLADAVDRRALVVATTTGSALAALGLAVQAAAGGRSLVAVLALVVAQTCCYALGAPARRTFIVALLPREQVPAGIALSHLSFQVAMLAGPALAGLVLATSGLGACYLIDAAALGVALYAAVRLPHLARAPGPSISQPPVKGWRATWAGWRLITARPALAGSVATDLAATALAMPIALFPAINDQRFGGDPATLGLFLSAIAVGGIAAGLTSARLTRARRPGAVQFAAAAAWGAALAGVGLVESLAPTLMLLAVAGAADTVSVISRGVVVQLETPPAYLGRISAVENIVGTAGPGIGNARAGAVAALTSPAIAATTGGLACLLAVTALAIANPALRRWAAPPQH